jgi:hypothetical protein
MVRVPHAGAMPVVPAHLLIRIAALACVIACSTEAPSLPVPGAPEPTFAPLAHPPTPHVWTVDGFATPESVAWDERSDLYLVSNINGGAHDADDNGFISRVSPPPDPRIVDVAWIDGADRDVTLHGPKGIAIAGELVYVVDVGGLRMFDRTTGEPRGMVDIPGLFVNDVVASGPPSDVAYVSVTGLDRSLVPRGESSIWEVSQGSARRIAAGAALGGANGLVMSNGVLRAVGFVSGELYGIVDGKPADIEALPSGVLDGIVQLPDQRFAVTSWKAAAVLIGRDGHWQLQPWSLPTPADLGYDAKRGLLLVPSFSENRVEMHGVGR